MYLNILISFVVLITLIVIIPIIIGLVKELSGIVGHESHKKGNWTFKEIYIICTLVFHHRDNSLGKWEVENLSKKFNRNKSSIRSKIKKIRSLDNIDSKVKVPSFDKDVYLMVSKLPYRIAMRDLGDYLNNME